MVRGDTNQGGENTLIKTTSGYKAANTINEGDELITYDETNKKTVANKVLSVIKSKASKLVKLFIKGEALTLTNYHPVYALAKGASYWRYIAADSITKGMLLLSLNGSTLAVDSTSRLDSMATVINYELANNHNYAIGNNALLIHNACFYNPQYININNYANFIDATGNPSALFIKFANDFNGNPSILAKFNNDINYIRAWELFGPYSLMRVNPDVLEAASKLFKNNADFVTLNLPIFENIITKLYQSSVLCRTCGVGGKITGSNYALKFIDKIVEDLDIAITFHKGKEGSKFLDVLSDMATQNTKAEGGAFMLAYLNSKGSTFAASIEKFEFVYLANGGFKADVKLLDGTLLEFKSWGKVAWGFLGTGDHILQLKAYIKSGNKFEYVVNEIRLVKDNVPDALKFVKEKFQTVFKDNNYAMFKSIENGGELYTKQQLIALFGSDNIQLIKLKIDDINNEFYNFIKLG